MYRFIMSISTLAIIFIQVVNILCSHCDGSSQYICPLGPSHPSPLAEIVQQGQGFTFNVYTL